METPTKVSKYVIMDCIDYVGILRRYFTHAINVVQNGVYSGGYIMAIHILLDSTAT